MFRQNPIARLALRQVIMSKTITGLLLVFAALFFGCFLFWPIAQTLEGAFLDADGKFTLGFVAAVLHNGVYIEGLRNALLIGLASTVAAFLIAFPLAWISDRIRFPGKKLFSTLLLVPMILPPFVGAIGIKQVFGQMGALNA